ncbi:MAG: hypothetical protein KC517_11845 [Bacteroidetes bacterium]|nr:hypothetical protein [Bacteroidota bacterium]
MSISGNGDRVAIGAQQNYGNGSNLDHTRVYEYSTALKDWIQLGQDINGEAQTDFSGISVSLSKNGKCVAIGAYQNDDCGFNAGHARIYRYNETNKTWIKMGTDIDGEAVNDESGIFIGIVK